MNLSKQSLSSSNRLPLFYVVTAFFWFSLYAYVPFVGPLAEELGADLRVIGLIAGAYGFTQMALRIPLGIFSDRLRRRKIFVLIGIGVAAVGGFVVFFFPSPYSLLASRALGGVAASAWVTFTVLGASYYSGGETTRAVGLLNMANSVGRVVALMVGALVALWFGITHVFLLGGLVGFVAFLFGLGIVENRPDGGKAPPRLADLLQVARNRQLLCTAFLGILIQYIVFATTFGFTPIVAVQLDASQFQLGLLGVASTLPGLVIAPLAGSTLPKMFGVRGTLEGGFLFAGLGAALIPFCTALWQLFVVQIVGSAGTIAVMTLLMGLCIADISPERRATAMGIFQSVYGLGMFLGPFATGWISHRFGLVAAFSFTGAVGLVGVGAVVAFAKRGNLRQ